MMLARLFRSQRGATVIEFAVLAPVFIVMLIGLIEFSRAYWVSQTLQEVAYHTARCMTLDDACDTEEKRNEFALERAGSYAIVIEADDITINAGVTCRSRPNSNAVAIETAFSSSMQGLLPTPATLRAEACFPVLG